MSTITIKASTELSQRCANGLILPIPGILLELGWLIVEGDETTCALLQAPDRAYLRKSSRDFRGGHVGGRFERYRCRDRWCWSQSSACGLLMAAALGALGLLRNRGVSRNGTRRLGRVFLRRATKLMTARTSQILLIIFSAFVTGLVVFSRRVSLRDRELWRREVPVRRPSVVLSSSIDQSGNSITDADIKGRPYLVFFGYTHCPDVCPTTLFDVSEVLRALGKDADRAGALFVTVDPERDTPAVMKDYLSSFDPHLRGATGDRPSIDAVEKAYRVYAKKVPTNNGDYNMDHTALVYLMDKQGRFVAPFSLKRRPEEAAADLRRYM